MGICKVELVSGLKEPAKYLEAKAEKVEQASTREIKRIVAAERKKARKGKTGKRETAALEIGRYELSFLPTEDS